MRRGGGPNVYNNGMPAMREDIQDLDRELELLRRKRQLIEDQQMQFQPTPYQQPQQFNRGQHAISPWEQQPQLRNSDFNQPHTSYNQNEFGFSNLYNSGQSNSGGGFDAGPRNRKRQFNGPRRQDESAGPKRFRDNRPYTGGNFNPPKKFTPKPKPFQGVGGSRVSVPPPQNKPSPKPFNKKPFIKPNERPAAGRPTKPLPSTATTDASNKKVEDKQAFLDYVIKDDDHTQYPKKVQGRIQFATSNILKNLLNRLDKESQAHTLYRHIKPILYARIQKVMLNKAVGNFQNIIDLYNAAFPSSTDDELVELAAAKEAERLKSIRPSLDQPESHNLDSRKTTDGPKDYFRNNITEVMEKKLTEMINKLKQTYEHEYNLQKTAQDSENVRADKKTGDTDTSPASTSADTETVSKSNNDEGTEPADAENAVTDENKPADEEKAGEAQVAKHSSQYMKNILNYHVTQVDDLVKREMWRLLTRVKDDLVAIMNMDKEFVNAKLTIAENADRMRRDLMNTPLHYVVLAGIPRLPKKAKLKTFLRHFHPNVIKKHRTVRNVLFIGFANPQDQANILKANNTIFEKAKLSIKETKTIGNAADNNEEKTGDNVMTEENVQELDESLQTNEAENGFQTEAEPVKEANESSDKVLDSDLDGQINDLLESINNESNPDDASEDVEMNENEENDFLNDSGDVQEDDAGENQDADDEQVGEGSSNVVAVEDAKGDDNPAEETAVEDANGDEKPAEETAVEDANGDEKPSEENDAVDANGDEKPAEENAVEGNKDDKDQAIGVQGAVKDKKAAVATAKRASTRVAASAVQTRRSSRLPN